MRSMWSTTWATLTFYYISFNSIRDHLTYIQLFIYFYCEHIPTYFIYDTLDISSWFDGYTSAHIWPTVKQYVVSLFIQMVNYIQLWEYSK